MQHVPSAVMVTIMVLLLVFDVGLGARLTLQQSGSGLDAGMVLFGP